MKRSAHRRTKQRIETTKNQARSIRAALEKYIEQEKEPTIKPSQMSTIAGNPDPELLRSGSAPVSTSPASPDSDLTDGSLFVPLNESADLQHDKAARHALHGSILTGGIYHSLLHYLVNDVWGSGTSLSNSTTATSVLAAGDFLRMMKPRDAMEELLLSQVLWTHGRIALLTNAMAYKRDVDDLARLGEMIERASNTFRRQMLTLAEYRRPAAVRGPVTSIEQANIAGQQIIMNQGAKENENTTNEQGCSAVPIVGALPAGGREAALSVDTSGARSAAGVSLPCEALEPVDRPQNRRG